MAQSRQLVAEVARVAGVPTATVEEHYRRLRALGMMTTGGRGSSAPAMTRRDATRLLLSVAISLSSATAAPRVGYYERLVTILRFFELMDALGLPECLRMGAVIERLAMEDREGFVDLRIDECTASIWTRIPGAQTYGKQEVAFLPHADEMGATKGIIMPEKVARSARVDLRMFRNLYIFVDEDAFESA